jgi:hypothetical protein
MRKLHAIGLAAAFGGMFGIGCAGKPSPEECEKFATHFVGLMLAGEGESTEDAAKALGDEVKKELVESCVKEGTKKEVDCVLAATSMDEVEANCK